MGRSKSNAESSEVRLAARFREGDEDAFRALFDRHAALFRGRIRRVLPAEIGRKISVADILQEARLVAYRRREDFEYRGPASWRNWLLGILDRRVQDAVKRYIVADKRAALREQSRGRRPDTANFVGRGPSPSEAAMGKELEERARGAIERLPPHYREVLRLAREEDLSLREVAVRLLAARKVPPENLGDVLVPVHAPSFPSRPRSWQKRWTARP